MLYMIRQIHYGRHIEIIQSYSYHIYYDMSALRFIDAWCLLYGSTYEGRKNACKRRLSIQQKVPILISEYTKDIIFPTCKISSEECVWINFRAVSKVKMYKQGSMIVFLDDSKQIVGCDIRTLRREMRLCEEYLQILDTAPY